jgi:hypothetical protein
MSFYRDSFDYLWSGYLPYIWISLEVILIGVLMFDLIIRLKRRFFGAVTEKGVLEQKEPTDSDHGFSSFNLQQLKKNLDELKKGQNDLIESISSVNNVLGRIEVKLEEIKNKDGKIHQNPAGHKYKTQSNSASAQSSPATNHRESATAPDMTALYNASRTDQSRRAEFREKYKPFCINVGNDVERRRDANLAPDFRQEDDGSYLAVSQANDQAVVFPNFTLVVVEAIYGPGALSEVFECDDFDRRFSYQHLCVTEPATFKSTGGLNWRVIDKGKLELGPAQES